jgi:hypothetical protein
MHTRSAATWRLPAALAVVFCASLPAVTPRIYASDEIEFFSFLRSIWFDRDVSFENEYRYFYDSGIARNPAFHETFLERTSATGLRLNFATIGPAILWAPFYAVADLVTRAAGGALGPANGLSAPYVAAVSYASAIYGFAAVLLSMRVAARVMAGSGLGPPAAAVIAGLAVWVGTPLFFYMYVAPPMSHAASAFAVSAFTLAWISVRERWSPGGLVGLAALAALMAMVREQDLFFGVGPLLDYAAHLVKEHRRDGWKQVVARHLPRAAAAVLAFAVVYLPQAAAYLALNGRVGPSQVVERKMFWTAPYAVSVLISPAHGFLFWTPLAAVALAGLVYLVVRGDAGDRGGKRLAWCFLAMVASQIYVTGSVASWTLAGAFGQRRFVALTPLLVIGLAVVLGAVRPGWRRAGVMAGVALGVWWNLGLVVQFGSGLMSRQRLEPARIAYNNFVIVPRQLPALAYRYAFARESFYRSPASDR